MTKKKRQSSNLQENGNLQSAEKELRDAIELNPYNVSNYIDLAAVLRDKGRSSEAMDMLLHARDRFVGNERAIIEKQLEKISGAEKPWERVVDILTESGEIEAPSIYCGHEGDEELLEEKLWEYAEGGMEEGEEEEFWKQVQGCRYCLSKLIKVQRALNDVQEEPGWAYERIHEVIEKREREKSVAALTSKFADMLKKSPANLRKRIETISEKVENLLRRTFAYPTPHFAPVFGELLPGGVSSPFGKVRYPVVFEWQPYEQADRYTLSVEDANWSHTTSGTRVEVSPQELDLMYDSEYMWELKAMQGEKVIEQENGFFSLPAERELREIEEIEDQINGVSGERDRLILWGGILEEKGFLMEAIENYKHAYAIDPFPGIAYRIAWCYDQLELEGLRDEWNKKIRS